MNPPPESQMSGEESLQRLAELRKNYRRDRVQDLVAPQLSGLNPFVVLEDKSDIPPVIRQRPGVNPHITLELDERLSVPDLWIQLYACGYTVLNAPSGRMVITQNPKDFAP